MDNIKNKVIIIEDSFGNYLCSIAIDDDGNIKDYNDCEIADTYDDGIKLQVI